MDSYFEQYCDYTGGMGIGFVASHTYDFRFRQHLKKTQDPELKRLFVLEHLHEDVDWALRDFQAGTVKTGKTSTRPLTLPEWQATQHRLLEQIDDLAAYAAFTNYATVDTDKFYTSLVSQDTNWIQELRVTIRGITNVPSGK